MPSKNRQILNALVAALVVAPLGASSALAIEPNKYPHVPLPEGDACIHLLFFIAMEQPDPPTGWALFGYHHADPALAMCLFDGPVVVACYFAECNYFDGDLESSVEVEGPSVWMSDYTNPRSTPLPDESCEEHYEAERCWVVDVCDSDVYEIMIEPYDFTWWQRGAPCKVSYIPVYDDVATALIEGDWNGIFKAAESIGRDVVAETTGHSVRVPLAPAGAAWRDCNRDGYVGLGPLGIDPYPRQLFHDPTICPPGSPWQPRNADGETPLVYENPPLGDGPACGTGGSCTMTQNYVGTSQRLIGLCPPECSDLVVAGGAAFPAGSGSARPVFVRVTDQTFSPVAFSACQDVDDDGLCGGPNDPSARGCGSGALAGFSAGVPLVVRVVAETPLASVCGTNSMGTTGTITVSYRLG